MESMFTSFSFLLMPVPLFYMALGVFLGISVGAIPGLSGSMLIALTVPLTFYMDSNLALVLLVSMYVGAISGGLITATLLRMPGTPASVVTTFDGYPMAKSGRPDRAVGVGIMASFVGGLISWVFLVTLSPPLAKFALKFGPFEFFALVMMALVMIAAVGEGSLLKGFISGIMGLLTGCPGQDVVSGTLRITFGFEEMMDGFSLIPVLIGMFGLSQLINDLVNVEQTLDKFKVSIRGMFLTLSDIKNQIVNLVRSSCIGTWVGILPGIGANIGSLLAYSAAKSASKQPAKFGTGCEEGIVASEAANNATIGGALVPLVTLGIPGSLVDAILLGALILHDLSPGPLLFRENPVLVYNIMNTSLIANFIMLVFMLGASILVARLVEIPKAFLVPTILVFCVLGTFAVNNRLFDVWVMLSFGLLGFLLEKASIPLGPFVIGLILGPLAEKNLRSGLMMSDGSLMPLVDRPLCLAFVIIALLTLVWTLYRELKSKKIPDGS